MEKYTFRFKNGKFLLKESYGAVFEDEAAAQPQDPSASQEKPADSAEKPEDKNATPDTVAKLLKSFGMSKEEILALYGKIKNWGTSGAGADTKIAFKDDILNKGLDDEEGKDDAKATASPATPSSSGGSINANAVAAAISNAASKGRVGLANAIDRKTALMIANAYNEFIKQKSATVKEGTGRAEVSKFVMTFLSQYEGGKYSKSQEVIDALTDQTMKANIPNIFQLAQDHGTEQRVTASDTEKAARLDAVGQQRQANASKQPQVQPKDIAPDTRTPEQKKSAEDADRQKGRAEEGLSPISKKAKVIKLKMR